MKNKYIRGVLKRTMFFLFLIFIIIIVAIVVIIEWLFNEKSFMETYKEVEEEALTIIAGK